MMGGMDGVTMKTCSVAYIVRYEEEEEEGESPWLSSYCME